MHLIVLDFESAQNTDPIAPMHALRVVGVAGLVCGVLDITAALVLYGYLGARRLRLLQGIAAGMLGRRSFDGGFVTASLGMLCHLLIALTAAAAYFAMSRRLHFLLQHAAVAGVVYGAAVYFFMNRIVVPLCRAVKYPFSWKCMSIGVTIHIFCVGLPISLLTSSMSWA